MSANSSSSSITKQWSIQLVCASPIKVSELENHENVDTSASVIIYIRDDEDTIIGRGCHGVSNDDKL